MVSNTSEKHLKERKRQPRHQMSYRTAQTYLASLVASSSSRGHDGDMDRTFMGEGEAVMKGCIRGASSTLMGRKEAQAEGEGVGLAQVNLAL